MKEIYFLKDGKIWGPVSSNELHSVKISYNTFIFADGFKKWMRAKNIPWMENYINSTIDSDDELPPPIFPNIEKIQPVDKYFGYTLASKKERFMVFIINTCIYLMFITLVFMVVFSVFYLLKTANDEEGFFYSFLTFYVKHSFNYIGFGAAILIGFAFYPKFSGTIGHKFLGLKVISSKDGSDFNSAANGIIRETLKSFLGVFIIPHIWLLWDEDNQNLYDKAGNTFVVKKHYSETLFD